MQTTLDVDADVLSAAEEISARTHCNTGKVISDLARAGLAATRKESPEPTVLNGFQVIPADGRVVTPELVRQLMDASE